MGYDVSCDKIRIKYRLKKYVEFYIPVSTYPDDYFESYDSKGLSLTGSKLPIGKYVHSHWFKLKGDESNIICFQGQVNGAGEIDNHVFTIEYNPNKHKLPPFVIAFLMVTKAFVYEIMQADFCYDFVNLPVSAIHFDANGHCQTMTFGTVGGSYARYLCPKAKDGRIKVYDKGQERKGKHDEEKYKGVTRIEITYQNTGFIYTQGQYDITNLWGEDLKRIKEMLASLQRVKLPWLLDGEEGDQTLNQGHLKAIHGYLERGEVNEAKEYVRLCFSSKAPRVKYNDYIRRWNGLKTFYESEGGYIPFAVDLYECLKNAIPKIA